LGGKRHREHAGDQLREFYGGLTGALLVGIAATGYSQWFERMLHQIGHKV
jgi:transposase